MLLSQSQIQQLYPQAESLVRHTRVGRTSHVSFNLTSFIFNRNFSRVSRGPEAGAYYHKFFLRDKPHHAAQMFCKNARSKLAMASTTSVDIERAQQPPLKQAEDTSSAGVANALEHPQQLGRQAPLPSQVQLRRDESSTAQRQNARNPEHYPKGCEKTNCPKLLGDPRQ